MMLGPPNMWALYIPVLPYLYLQVKHVTLRFSGTNGCKFYLGNRFFVGVIFSVQFVKNMMFFFFSMGKKAYTLFIFKKIPSYRLLI